MFIRIAQASFLGFCMWIVAAYAESGAVGSINTKPNDTSNIPEIQRIIQTHQLSLSDAFLERAGGHPDIVSFCETFLTDLKAGRVEYIKPVLTTNDPNHPELKRFQSCRNHVHTPEELKQGAGVFRDLSEIGTNNFRLYRLELEGKPDNGLEEVVYGEKEKTNPPIGKYPGGLTLEATYEQITATTCTFAFGKTLTLRTGKTGAMVMSTLARYQGATYIVQLGQNERKFRWVPAYGGGLWGHDYAPGLHNTLRCEFAASKEE
jgi:hypothetical protein